MKLQLDLSKKYAIALEGGGAKGAYEIGVWQAFEEVGLQYYAVSGASVGALNGALMAMRDLQKAVQLWENIRFSQVIDVNDEKMKAFFDRELALSDVPSFLKDMAEVMKNKGFDSTPLRNLLQETIEPEKIRQSDVDFYLVTYSLSDKKTLDLDAKTLDDTMLYDMLLASAYFPAFRQQPLGGKYYTDGGIQNVIPIDSLLDRGYRDIIAIRIFGFGWERKVKIPEDANITVIAPNEKLANMLQFDQEQSKKDMRLGYYDGLRVLYGLKGKRYYIDSQWNEAECYAALVALVRRAKLQKGKEISLKKINEEILPRLAKKKKAKRSYQELLWTWLEDMAEEADISPFCVRTEKELLELIGEKRKK